jgi:hypothetical protein
MQGADGARTIAALLPYRAPSERAEFGLRIASLARGRAGIGLFGLREGQACIAIGLVALGAAKPKQYGAEGNRTYIAGPGHLCHLMMILCSASCLPGS